MKNERSTMAQETKRRTKRVARKVRLQLLNAQTALKGESDEEDIGGPGVQGYTASQCETLSLRAESEMGNEHECTSVRNKEKSDGGRVQPVSLEQNPWQ